MGHQVVVLPPDLLEGQVALRSRVPGGGEAHRAAQIAAAGQLQQGAAALAQVLGAQPAVIGAAFLRLLPLPGGIHGAVFRAPAGVAGQVPLPDQSGKCPVFGAFFIQIYAVPLRALLGVQHPQAQGTDAFGPPDDHSKSPRSDRISMHFS